MKKFYGRLKQCFLGLVVVALGQNADAQTCPPNIDFEQGSFANWQLFTGSTSASGSTNQVNVTSVPAPVTGRHLIFPATVAGNDLYGGFPMNPPGGSQWSVKLGNNLTGAEAERVSYQFTVPVGSTEYSLVYQYAVVFENPPHQAWEQPRFNAKVIDAATGNYISCASFEFVATSGLPGFSQSPNNSSVWFKDWTAVTINLSGYGGKTVIIEFTTADCTQSGHWGYAYVDVNAGCASPVSGVDFCPNEDSITLTAPHGYQSYTWYNTVPGPALGTQITTQQNLIVTPPPANNTVYAVVLEPFPGFGCTDTVFATATALPVPVADAGPDKLLCTNSGVTIGTPAAPGFTYSWAPAAGLSDPNIAEPTALPATTTTYVLTVTGNLGGCVERDTVTVTVNQPFNNTFTVNAVNQCLDGNNYQFNVNNPAGLNYEWYFGDEAAGDPPSSTQQNPTHQYAAAGTYPVKLIVAASNGCKDSSEQNMVVSPMPVADAGADKLLCGGTGASSVIGTPAVAGNTYSWSPATGLSDPNIAEPTASPAATTQYILTVTGTGGCIDKDTVNVNVTPSISGSFTINTANQCLAGNNYQFTSDPSNPSGLTYEWIFGDGPAGVVQSTQANPTYQYTTTGSFTVELVVSASGGSCSANSSQVVVLSPSPVADAGVDKLLCGGTGASTQIGTPAIAGNSYSWSPATGLSNPNVAEPTASPTTTTDYIVTVTGPGGCITKDTVNVQVTQTLSAAFNVNNQTQCITGNNFQFTKTNPVAGLNYAWNFGDQPAGTVQSTQQDPSHQYTTAGQYTVTLEISTASGCQATASKDITVIPVPVGSISSIETNICEGTPVVLTASGTANSFKWYKDNVLVGTTTTNTYSALEPGTYTVELDNGCVNPGTGSVILTITRKPTVDFSFTTMCLGQPTPFTDASNVTGSTPVDYSWNFGTTDVPGSTQPSPVITYPNPGTYSVQFTITPQACPQLATTAQENVEIKGPEVGIVYPEVHALENTPTQMTARNIGSTYAWSPGTNLTSTSTRQTTFQGMQDMLYTVTITNDLGCVTVDTQMVKVYKEVNIYMPKAFTPNGDGQNDYLFPYVIGIKEIKIFRVINRWGVIVFESRSDKPGWDGRYKGTAQPMDGYVWEIQAIDYFGKTHNRHGSFTLLR